MNNISVTETGKAFHPTALKQHVLIEDREVLDLESQIQQTPEVATPLRILFGMFDSLRVRIKKALPVEVERSGDSVVAVAVNFQEFGCGTNFSEALDDLAKTLTELFLSLDENSDRLGDDLQQLRVKLNEHLEKRGSHEGS